MKVELTKKDVFTIPNMLSMFRIILIPVIVVLYCNYQMYKAATIVLFLSGCSDVADGWIARKFNMISDFGKVLDPLADKLTQATIVLCLMTRYPHMLWLFVLMAIKETIMLTTGALTVHYSGKVLGSEWHGKLATCAIYTLIVVHIVWYNISMSLSEQMAFGVACVMLLSLALYTIRNFKVIRAHKE